MYSRPARRSATQQRGWNGNGDQRRTEASRPALRPLIRAANAGTMKPGKGTTGTHGQNHPSLEQVRPGCHSARCCCFCCNPLATLLAAPAAVIDGLQMPAWRERGAQREPLRPRLELASGDKLITGESARVLVRVTEGSSIKWAPIRNLNSRPSHPEHRTSCLCWRHERAQGRFSFYYQPRR